jgi:hypothetical protein
VLLDETGGAKTSSGESLSPAALMHIAEAMMLQLNGEFADCYGGSFGVRVGASSADIQPGERAYSFVPTLPDAPTASAYHDIDGKGVPFALCAVTTCDTLLGAGSSVSVDASHEGVEAGADPGCNVWALRADGVLVAYEVGDPVEVQAYPKTCKDGTIVYVSNFVTPAWFEPGNPGPFDYMCAAGLPGGVPPAGPMQLAPGAGGNYLITASFDGSSEGQVFGMRRKGTPHWSSRAARRLAPALGRS